MKKQPRKRIDIVSLKLVRESTTYYSNRKIRSPEDAAEIFRNFIGDSDREKFALMCLNSKNEPVSLSLVSQGSLNAAIVHPREVFKTALMANSASIITGIQISHNHPSGDPTPSKEDVEITKRLMEAGKILGIELLDHIVLGENSFVSAKEKELIRRSIKVYVEIVYEQFTINYMG
ncbi:MAG: JAB domain-containing protein [Clostridiaceae bacterium]|nr:JAB domain-containing protein [Clostridiaceae bacterium]